MHDEALVRGSALEDVLFKTGPYIILGALRNATGLVNGLSGPIHSAEGMNIMVYPLGKWYLPCFFNDAPCKERIERERGSGEATLELAGYHRYSNSWHTEGKIEKLQTLPKVRRIVNSEVMGGEETLRYYLKAGKGGNVSTETAAVVTD